MALHFSSRRHNFFVFTLPRSGIQNIVFEAHFRIGSPSLWRDRYVRWGLVGCELAHSLVIRHLRLVDANFVYQLIVIG